jgi:hypothetical protein
MTIAAGAARRYLLAIGLLYLLAQWPLWGYVTDDTYIHLVYARHLLLGDGWVFNLGEPSYGSTSPLWVLLLAPFASGEAAGLLAARILAVGAGLIAIPVFYRLAARSIRSESLRLTATLLFATEVWFLRWAASGMEASLAVLVLLALFERLAAAPYRGGVFVIGLLAGLACLVRPEFYLLAALLLGAALLSARWRRRWLPLAAGVALPVLPWLLFAQWQFGEALPHTAAAKSGAWQGLDHLLIQSGRLLRVPLSSQGLLLALAGLGLATCLFGGRCRELMRGRHALAARPGRFRFYAALALAWGLALPIAFLARDIQVISRYLLVVTPLLPLGAVYCFEAWSERRPGLLRLLPLLIVLHLAPNLTLYFTRVLPYARQFSDDLESSLGRIADYLALRAPAGSGVAAPDIGLLGLRADCRIVDLGGLIHPEIAALWQRMGYDAMLDSLAFLPLQPADFLVDRAPVAARLAGRRADGRMLLPLLTREVQGLGLRSPQPQFYTLYRIGPLGELAPRPAVPAKPGGAP